MVDTYSVHVTNKETKQSETPGNSYPNLFQPVSLCEDTPDTGASRGSESQQDCWVAAASVRIVHQQLVASREGMPASTSRLTMGLKRNVPIANITPA